MGLFGRPERVFAVVGGLCALALAILTPPFQSPDEHQHLFRAYQLSELRIVPFARDGRIVVTVPTSLLKLATTFLGTAEPHPRREIHPRSLVDVVSIGNNRLRPTVTAEAHIAAAYPPTGYVAQAAGVGVARLVGAGPLGLLYAARIANVLFCVAIVTLALRLMPVGRYVGLSLALLPMSLAMFASAAPDGPVIAASVLFAALAQRAVLTPTRWDLPIALAALLVFGVAKLAYAPLAFASAASRRGRGAGLTAGLLICALLVVWLALAPAATPRVGSDVARQFHCITAKPLSYLWTLTATLIQQAQALSIQGIGVLGLLNVLLPSWGYLTAGLSIGLSLLADDKQQSLPGAALTLWWGLAAAAVGAFMTALYLQWNTPCAPQISGAQGRYFLPLLPILLCSIAIGGRKHLTAPAALCAVVAAISGPVAIVLAYRPL